MDLKEYGEGARKTESLVGLVVEGGSWSGVGPRSVNARLLHAVMGLSTEAGEMMDVLKRHIFYGQDLDHGRLLNLLEEAGDICWYLFGILLDELGKQLNLEDPAQSCLKGNLAKLQSRYGGQFNQSGALCRDTDEEMRAMQSAAKFGVSGALSSLQE